MVADGRNIHLTGSDAGTAIDALALVEPNTEQRKLVEEKQRVLYVALTRAKEKLIMTGAVKNLETLLGK